MRKLGILAVFTAGLASPAAALPPCEAFLQRMRTDGADLGVDYSRALVVSRVHSSAANFDISTRSDVDGTLVCEGDQFVRFEAHALEPLRGKASEGFERLQAAMRSGGALDRAVPFEDCVDNSLALTATGRHPPQSSGR